MGDKCRNLYTVLQKGPFMKRSFLSYVKLYFMMISQDFKSKMQYRADFLVSTLAMLLINISGLISFWLIFNSIPMIKGFSYNELLFMYGFSLIAFTPMQLFFDNLWQLWTYTENGDFIKYCFKPINIFFYYIAETFDAKGLGQLAFGLITLVYAWAKLAIPVTFFNIAMLIFTLIGAGLVLIGIMTLAASASFITLQGASVMIFVNRFKDYAMYPTTIFNTLFKFIFTFIIPIGFIAFYPVLFFLRPSSHAILAFFSPLVGIILFYIAYKVWMLGAKRYSGTGS